MSDSAALHMRTERFAKALEDLSCCVVSRDGELNWREDCGRGRDGGNRTRQGRHGNSEAHCGCDDNC